MTRNFTLTLLITAFLSLGYSAQSDASEGNTIYTTTTEQEGTIGAPDDQSIDNPVDNIFHVEIKEDLCGEEQVYLSYELYGVQDHTAVSRSINDQLAVGGYLVEEYADWTTQREEISAAWLRKGDNVIRFTVPEGATHHYKIKNVRIEVASAESEESNNRLVINQGEGKYYGDQAYIKGFVAGELSSLLIDGESVTPFKGEFEHVIARPEGAGMFWNVSVTALFADGTTSSQLLSYGKAAITDFSYTLKREANSAEACMDGEQRQRLTVSGASIEVPQDALYGASYLSITTLREVDIPALDAGMVNVTAGHAGYRFLPHGTIFEKAAKIILPYDADKIPSGYTEKDIKTYFFDEQAHHWVALPLDSVVVADGEIWSGTMHFTDMINGVIQVPESPEVNAYNSTSMKGIKAANPTAGINLMQPPSASNMGNASMSYPLNIPSGRKGMQPQVTVNYTNAGGNSWLGWGWNMSSRKVSIETRWGVPRYDVEKETETYSLDGQMLSPVAHRGEPVTRTSEKQFHPRVEGAFQRIIRHGDSPANYWWEVTEKDGTRLLYGGTSTGGFNAASVLRIVEEGPLVDEAPIAEWRIAEVIDLNGNSVQYHYEKVFDSGTGDGNGSVKGHEIYCSEITYTHHSSGEPGLYSVEFLRNTDGERRPDVTIDGRLGFKRVTADRLTRVNVKFDGNMVRHYEFGFSEGAFHKSLLTELREYDAEGELFTTHNLEYYDDVRVNGEYRPFADSTVNWNPGQDNIDANFITGKLGFPDDASALSGNEGVNFGFGMTIAIGIFDGNLASKSNTIGGSVGYSQADTDGRVYMIDINGDGLPDKVFEKGGRLWYRANLTATRGVGYFSDSPIQIFNASSFYKDRSKTINAGVEAQAGIGASVFVGAGKSFTKTLTTVYFTDANGDQLVDLVVDGRVLYNTLDLTTGEVTFTSLSNDTPNPIDQSVGVDTDIFEVDQQEIEEAIDNNPLHDVVRMWRAPFDGTINIEAPVNLVAPAEASDAHDGVLVSIQLGDNESLWKQRIEAGDYGTYTPSGVSSLSVSEGDQLYFRVQSIENGSADVVNWSPAISYEDSVYMVPDANGKLNSYYSASEDFVFSSPLEISVPINGQISIKSLFEKPLLTDDLLVEIIRTHNGVEQVEYSQSYGWDATALDSINLSLAVDTTDVFSFKVSSVTNVDWSAISWKPELFYTASFDPNVPVVVRDGEYLIHYDGVPDFTMKNDYIYRATPLIITKELDSLINASANEDSVSIAPDVEFPSSLFERNNGTLYFSVKRRDTLVYKDTLTVSRSQVVSLDTVMIPAEEGDTLYFEYHTEDEALANAVRKAATDILINDTTLLIEAAAGLALPYVDEDDFILGPLYRGWGHFAYNGNRDRADQKINESELRLSDQLNGNKEYEGGSVNNPDELDDRDPYDPSSDNFIMLYARGDIHSWSGFDEFTWLNGEQISSSRLGDDDIRPFQAFSDGQTSMRAINKISKSTNNSVAAGGGFGPVNGSATIGNGNSRLLTDYMDMNGDRYPDIVTEKGVQFTLPTGKLEESYGSLSTGVVNRSTMSSAGASVGGFFSLQSKGSTTDAKANRSDAGSAKTSGTISVNLGSGNNENDFSWMDVNGDGLPDRINANGKVALNLGYRLAEEETWGHVKTSDSKSTSIGGGLGFSVGSGSQSSSISGGVGVSLSENSVIHTLQDVTGDGLIDEVYINDGVQVRINTGNGYSDQAYSWNGLDEIVESSTTSESANAAFTACIPLVPILPVAKLCFNPSGNVGQSMSRDEKRLSDIDGDGYPDYLRSAKDNELASSPGKIGRTNMLKTVTRPLGASFTLDYKPEGSTYAQPNTVWTLAGMEMYDGFSGDGADTMRTRYTYENGQYNRREREFYGFEKVTTTSLDTEDDDAPYTIATQTFDNSTYYRKGLLLQEVMTDAEGNKYVEKEIVYQLKALDGTGLPNSFAPDDGVAFQAMTSTTEYFYEGEAQAGKSTAMTYEYDVIGNVIRYTDEGDTGTEDDLEALITYHDFDGPYIKGTAKSITVNSAAGTLRNREADINPSTGNLTQIVQYLEDESAAVYDFEYDSYGNLTKLTRPENSNGERFEIQYEYDDQVNTYPTQVRNSYGYASSATYDLRFGQLTESIDLNNQKISYELDAVGRPVQITGPYEQQGAPYSLAFEYYHQDAVAWALTKHYDPQHRNNDMETATFVDGMGRVIQTKKDVAIYQGDNKPDKEMMTVSGRAYYDGFGRTVSAHYPVLEDKGNSGVFNEAVDNIDPTITDYDVLNRALTVTLPDGSVTSTEYGFDYDRNNKLQFLTRTTDANGLVTDQFTDVRGRVAAVKNVTTTGNVWTSFQYNAINEQIAATNDLGQTTRNEYDWFGRRVQRIHPDAGKTTYNYDLSNNLTSLVTANLEAQGQVIEYTYEYQRLTDITYPVNTENNVHYTYGEAGADHNRAGRIVIQEDASGAQEFFYGPLGEVIKNIRTIVIPGFADQTYATEWTYDTWNRLESMIYPDGEEVTYHYNEGGLLHSMEGKKKGASYAYVDQLGYDKFEQRVFLAYGNGTKTSYTYEADRRRLKNMTAATAANRLFMDNAYTYDRVNNIISLKNNAPVPSSNLMGGASEYTYEYDDLYRLVTAQGKYEGPNEQHRYNLEMSYNSVGGILQKTQSHERSGGPDENSWTTQKKTSYDNAYDYGNVQPNAPVHIGRYTYTYDANGNQTGWTDDLSGQRRNILWDEENRVRSISDNGADYHYIYDASGERVLKAKGTGQSVYNNGKRKAGTGQMGNYTVYVNPYIVLRSGGYTKHYYIESQRVLSKLGGGIDNKGQGPLKAGGDQINYSQKSDQVFDGIVRNQKFLSPDGTLLTAGKSGKVPPGQIIGGSTDNSEKFQYFYHPDHLGSTSYITDASGEVYQHLEYFAFGGTFVEEHSNTHRTPYLFNGKELDEETGLYYYGARYYDPQTSIFLEVDPLADKYVGWSPYAYTFNNPIRFSDPTGMEGEDETGPTLKEAARLAEHVYDGKKGDVVDGWEMMEVYEDKDNYGYRAGLYRRENDAGEFEYVMANAGTADMDDASENLEQPFGGSEHMVLSISKARELNDQLGNASLTFVGHSKGGAEAAGNALATNRNAMLFNPAAINAKAYGLNSKNYTGSMTAYIVRGEILHSQLNWWMASPIDQQVFLPRQHGSWFRNGLYYQVKNHMMSAVISAIDEYNAQ